MGKRALVAVMLCACGTVKNAPDAATSNDGPGGADAPIDGPIDAGGSQRLFCIEQ